MTFKKSLFLLTMVLGLSPMASAKVYRYISIDSGGMLGVIPAHLLADIEAKAERPLYQLVDGMMGTSTGAIVSALLTVPAKGREAPFAASEIADFYRKRGTVIFAAATQSVISNKMAPFLGMKVDFSAAAGVLKSHTDEIFAEKKLSNALVDLTILSFDKSTNKVWLFESKIAKMFPSHDGRVSDAVRASGSVADAFGPMELQVAGEKKTFVDAGSVGVRPNVNDPTPYLVDRLASVLGETDEAVIYSLGTGFSRGAVAALAGRNIKVVRIEPNIATIMDGRGMLAMNLLSATTDQKKIDKMVELAERLKSSPEYQQMLADLTKPEGHQEL